jgi:hypothetical protein
LQTVSFDTGPQDGNIACLPDVTSSVEMAVRLTAQPMYREARVIELRRRITAGNYDVPAEQIVERLIGRLLLEAAPA